MPSTLPSYPEQARQAPTNRLPAPARSPFICVGGVIDPNQIEQIIKRTSAAYTAWSEIRSLSLRHRALCVQMDDLSLDNQHKPGSGQCCNLDQLYRALRTIRHYDARILRFVSLRTEYNSALLSILNRIEMDMTIENEDFDGFILHMPWPSRRALWQWKQNHPPPPNGERGKSLILTYDKETAEELGSLSNAVAEIGEYARSIDYLLINIDDDGNGVSPTETLKLLDALQRQGIDQQVGLGVSGNISGVSADRLLSDLFTHHRLSVSAGPRLCAEPNDARSRVSPEFCKDLFAAVGALDAEYAKKCSE